MRSTKPERPVEPILVKLLSHVNSAARALALPYFVGGAFARDLLLSHVHGFDLPRPTRDVDIGIAVRGWEDFDRVKEQLTGTHHFLAVKGITHRLLFKAAPETRGIYLDIVPFAGVEERDSLLRWPPDGSVVMNVVGFDEALARAEQIKISNDLVVPVASLPGLTLLKLAAWLDRRDHTARDAVDLLIFFRRYGDAGNIERLYQEYPHLLEAADFDVECAGATLLGEDVRAMAKRESYERLSVSYTSTVVQGTFLTQVSSGVPEIEGDRVGRAKTLVDAFFTGFGATNESA